MATGGLGGAWIVVSRRRGSAGRGTFVDAILGIGATLEFSPWNQGDSHV